MKEREREKIQSGLQKLEQMGCVVRSFRDGDFEFPKNYEVSAVPKRFQRKFLEKLHHLEDFVRMPAIEDKFTYHSERVRWFSTLDREAYLASQHNRLTGNQFNVVFLIFSLLEDKYLSGNRDIKQRIIEIEESAAEQILSNKSGKYTLENADAVADAALKVLKLFEKSEIE